MIIEQVEQDEPIINGLIKPDKLTDGRMQQFVDEWYGLLERCDGEIAYEHQEQLLIDLAKEIS
jgi:hypothetical protein